MMWYFIGLGSAILLCLLIGLVAVWQVRLMFYENYSKSDSPDWSVWIWSERDSAPLSVSIHEMRDAQGCVSYSMRCDCGVCGSASSREEKRLWLQNHTGYHFLKRPNE